MDLDRGGRPAAPDTRGHPIVQIVPPGPGGVRDYALALQAQWAARGEPSVMLDGEAAMVDRGLLSALEAAAGDMAPRDAIWPVVLHFSGYGYARRGLCVWLPRALDALRTALGPRLRLVIVFHELYAHGPPWRSAFWLSRLQAGIAARLAAQADAVWTNGQAHADWLQPRVRPGTPVEAWPVFSNVGEPDDPPDTAKRAASAVLFGSAPTRQRALDALRGRGVALRALGIESIVEVGGGATQADALDLPLLRLGRLDGGALTAALCGSRWALIAYPSELLGKSGVFAACAAHGCAVLNTDTPGIDLDGLRRGQHHLTLSDGLPEVALGVDLAQTLAARLRHWYATHRLPLQAERLQALTRR